MKNESLIKAIKKIGSQKELADRLGVSPQRVQWWTKHRLPPKWVIPVESVTGTPRHQLRPDIYPPENNTSHAAA
jgi:DNA-binding transcriptional regulator YdaS (Cro superfamily)